MRVKDIRPAPAEIEYKGMKFLITDRPNDQTIPSFILVSINKIFRLIKSPFKFYFSFLKNATSFSMKQLVHRLILSYDWQELKKHNVKEVVRVCEPTYKVEELKEEGINVIDLAFDDGTFPPNEVSYSVSRPNITIF